MDTFVQGSTLHLTCLAVCVLATITTALLARRFRDREGPARILRHGIVVGCLGSWILSSGYGLGGGRFSWAESLPLHFCNLANLIGAHAIATRHRTSQSLVYFWTFALCLWAFLTPSLYVGPASPWFWLFWLYHVFIPIAATWVIVGERFRPDWSDWRKAVFLTLLYVSLIAIVDALTGWNYGFVGPGTPTQANILDFLGPYPLRLLWMTLIAASLFTLLMLPWISRRKKP